MYGVHDMILNDFMNYDNMSYYVIYLEPINMM